MVSERPSLLGGEGLEPVWGGIGADGCGLNGRCVGHDLRIPCVVAHTDLKQSSQSEAKGSPRITFYLPQAAVDLEGQTGTAGNWLRPTCTH